MKVCAVINVCAVAKDAQRSDQVHTKEDIYSAAAGCITKNEVEVKSSKEQIKTIDGNIVG